MTAPKWNARTWAVLAGIACFAIVAWRIWPTPPAPATEVAIAPPAAPVAESAKVDTAIKTKTVKAHTPAAKKRLGLPRTIQADPAKVVLDSVDVPAEAPSSPSLRLTTLMDTDTGETVTLAEKRPPPWLAAGGRNSIWLGPAFRLRDARPVVGADLQYGLLSVRGWEVRGRLAAEIPTDAPGEADGLVGVGVGRTW